MADKKEAEEKKYTVTLPISAHEKQDVWVCINGKGTLIKRGEPVEVSEAVYEVLMNKQRMERLAFDRSAELEGFHKIG